MVQVVQHSYMYMERFKVLTFSKDAARKINVFTAWEALQKGGWNSKLQRS